jgi:hypothetical protein
MYLCAAITATFGLKKQSNGLAARNTHLEGKNLELLRLGTARESFSIERRPVEVHLAPAASADAPGAIFKRPFSVGCG